MKSGSNLAKGPAWKAAEALGCDMSIIEVNLQLSPQERMIRHDRAIRLALKMRKAALKTFDGLSDAIEKVP